MCEDRILFTFLLLATSLMAQNIQVKGLVKDPAGEAIIGASVVVKGTTNGSITDLDGKFSLSDVPSGATITVSYIGYLSPREESIRYTHGVYSERRH